MTRPSSTAIDRLPPWVAVLVALALALALRLPSLGDFSPFGDEGVAWRLSSVSVADLIAKRHEQVPPLYFFLIGQWSHLFGASMFALRAFSLLCTLGTIVVVFFFCRDVFARSDDIEARRRAGWIGAVAALLTACSSSHHFYGQYARLYPMALLLGTVTPWTLWRALHAPPGTALRRWAIWVVLSAASFYTQNLALLTVLGQCVLAAGIVVYEARGDLRAVVRSPRARQLVAAGIAFVALSLPLIPAILTQYEDPVWHPFQMEPLTLESALLFFTQTLWPVPFHEFSTTMLGVFAAGLVAFYVAGAIARGLPAVYVVGCALIPYLGAVVLNLGGGPAIIDRFVLWAHPFMVVMIALVIVEYLPRAVAAVIVVAVLVCQIWLWRGFVADFRDGRPGTAAVNAYLRSLPREATTVVVMPDEYLNVLYYAHGLPDADFRMYLPEGSRKRAYGFAVLLLPGEGRIHAEELDAIATPRMVTVDLDGDEDPVPTPSETSWHLVDTREVDAPYSPSFVVKVFGRNSPRP